MFFFSPQLKSLFRPKNVFASFICWVNLLHNYAGDYFLKNALYFTCQSGRKQDDLRIMSTDDFGKNREKADGLTAELLKKNNCRILEISLIAFLSVVIFFFKRWNWINTLSWSKIQPEPNSPGGKQTWCGELVCQVSFAIRPQQAFALQAEKTVAEQRW